MGTGAEVCTLWLSWGLTDRWRVRTFGVGLFMPGKVHNTTEVLVVEPNYNFVTGGEMHFGYFTVLWYWLSIQLFNSGNRLHEIVPFELRFFQTQYRDAQGKVWSPRHGYVCMYICTGWLAWVRISLVRNLLDLLAT